MAKKVSKKAGEGASRSAPDSPASDSPASSKPRAAKEPASAGKADDALRDDTVPGVSTDASDLQSPEVAIANEAIAATLHELARLLEVTGEDSFRVSAHARAARAIESVVAPVSRLTRDQLLQIDGIGPKLADKIQALARGEDVPDLTELRAKVPPGVLTLMNIPGLGPKTARTLWIEGNVTSIESLRKAIDDGSLVDLPRMGAKSVDKIRDALAFASSAGRRVWIAVASELAERIVDGLRAVDGVAKVEPAGSLRRGKETVGDLDIVVALGDGAPSTLAPKILSDFSKSQGVTKVIALGDTKTSVRMSLGVDFGRWTRSLKEDGDDDGAIQVDVRVVPLASFGAAMCYFTGSKEHNVKIRERAQKMGLTLNEWGLYPEDGASTPPHQRGVKSLAGASEEDVYHALKMEWVPPQMREDRGEIEIFDRNSGGGASDSPSEHAGAARATYLPLVELADIKAELHAHTTASDGVLSIVELAEHAKARGFHTIAVTDHSKTSGVAGGLSIERLLAHIDAVRAANSRVSGIKILAGSEVDILINGSLDYPDDILAQLDVVVASPHQGLTQDPVSATKRLLRAIENPYVNIVGHPTGRLINKRSGLSPDMPTLFKAAAERGVALEINAHWMRLDLRDTHVRAAVDAGCLIAIDCDVHEARDYDNLRWGVTTARRGWCPKDRCVNTWEAPKLHAWLKRGRKG